MTTSSRNPNYTRQDYIKRYGLPLEMIDATDEQFDAAVQRAIETTSFRQRVLNDPDEE